MEKSIFGSAIKTYPSKRNRFSSFRPSSVYRDDNRFDQLFEDEENKRPLTVRKPGFERGGVRNTKSYLPSSHKAPILKNIQNYSCITRKSTIPTHTKKKKVKTKSLKRNKENTLRCHSRLYKSDSDSDKDLQTFSPYSLIPSLNPMCEQKNLVAQTTKLTPKSHLPKIINDINTTSSNESKSPKLPIVITDHSNNSICRSNPSPAKHETIFKKPACFVERSSDLFYKNSLNKNRGQTKTRRKILFRNESHSLDNEYDLDNSGIYANNLPRISGIRRNALPRFASQNIDELFNSVNENENEVRCSEAFSSGTASTPNFDRQMSPDQSCQASAKDENCAKPAINLNNVNRNGIRCSKNFNPGTVSASNFDRITSTNQYYLFSTEDENRTKSVINLDSDDITIRCSEDFNPVTVSTPNFYREKLHNHSCGTSTEDKNSAKPIENTSHCHLLNNSVNSRNSPMNQSEASSQNIHLAIDDTQNSIKNDKIECDGQSFNNSSTSNSDIDFETEEEIGSMNNSVSAQFSTSDANLDRTADILENDSLLHDVKCSSPPNDFPSFSQGSVENDSLDDVKCETPPSTLSPFSRSKENVEFGNNVSRLASEFNLFRFENKDSSVKNDELTNNVSKLANQLNSCSLESEQDSSVNDKDFANNLSVPTNRLHSSNITDELDESKKNIDISNDASPLINQSHSCSHKDEQERSETTESDSVIDDSSVPVQKEKMINSFSSIEAVEELEVETSLNEIAECLTEEIRDLSSINDTEFAGFSEEEYDRAAELREAFRNVCKEPNSKFFQSEDEVPAHLKHITRRRKKTCIMPTLNEENSNLEDDEGDLNVNARNSPMPSQNLQAFSQNQTTLQVSRFLERSSMMSQSIVLATGKKWRRSFITLKNIREYGFQIQTENEELKGRCWRKNVEDLISSLLDENLDLKEIGESSTIRTISNETFLNPNYTCLDNSRRPNKARFSLCVNIKSPAPQQLQSDESSGLTSSSDTSKLFGDKSYISFVGSQQNSRVENNYDLEAGDYSRSCKVSIECYDIRDHLSAKESVLRYCKQTEPLPFDECFNNRLLQNCKKIGEGVYGEVFMLKRNRAHCSVLKVIPIEGDQLINGERQKKFDEIVSELVISIELSDLRKRTDYYTDNFAELQRCWCVYGKYPKRLIELWDDYNNSKGSDNDSPKVFDDSQLYIILELSHGGEDVESFVFNNAQQALSVFVQVAYALAVAEQAFSFEHRDLHWGNILVSKTKEERTKFIIGDFESTVRLRGVKVTIIDYTLSRISINNCIVFNDIGQDPDLFTAQGDFQFEVYRLMKDEVKNVWNQFMPKTNVYWLCYLLDKMIKEVRYRRVTTQIHQTNFKRLEEFYELILGFASCQELIFHSYFTRTVSATR